MLKNNFKFNLDKLFRGIILFTLPFPNFFNSAIIIISVAYFIYRGFVEKTLNNLKYFWLSFIVFFFQFLSFCNSTNYESASNKLILFIPFLVFPFLFIPSIKKKKLDNYILFSFLLYGVMIILLYGTVMFLYDVIFLNVRYDYGRGVALFLKYAPHHVYLSMLILISVFLTVKGIAKRKLKEINFVFIPILFLFLFLLGSRMAMFIAVFILPLLLFNVLKVRYNTKKMGLIVLLSFILLSSIGFANKFSREKIIFTYFELAKIATDRRPFNGISYREQIWESSFAAIKESPFFGYGVGDVQYKLNSKYSMNSFYNVIGMNSHNQYFQFLLSYGIIFSSILFFLILRLVYFHFKRKENEMFFVWLIIFLFSFTESILNRHLGVILFAFILNISIYRLYDKEKVAV